ncbi:GLPGLI family protein [Mucilaginibacter sp. HMF5004]|uniref:GLPGLI family protein n=1 Tax=Mucilaginibacter rivuli TaxID=2857527 RepID=UPI001C600F30|nr:GLPGLI family protein [Mucilaginibacter rivuli]MBW4889443.1 GLPGLI family protein [Mucilaginibacter rivuli]
MKRILTLLACALLLSGQFAKAQYTHFTTVGTIEYDRTVNMYAVIKRMINKENETWYGPMYEAFKKSQPQFKTLKSTLTFSKDRTMFTPIEPEVMLPNNFGSPMAEQNNTIYTDLANKLITSNKNVFEDKYLLKDSVRKINWKITSETRDIAGFHCRRANALVLDSVYVVAFYTDQIPVSGGPESFAGLPGMILGVAIPHENITWFATKVTDVAVTDKALTPPAKGKPTTVKQLSATIHDGLKSRGWYSDAEIQAILKAFLL